MAACSRRDPSGTSGTEVVHLDGADRAELAFRACILEAAWARGMCWEGERVGEVVLAALVASDTCVHRGLGKMADTDRVEEVAAASILLEGEIFFKIICKH